MFLFNHSLAIAINEQDQRNLYSFYFNCSEAGFMHHVINHYYLYQQFIHSYHLKFSNDINIERENFQAGFPPSDIILPENITFSSAKKEKLNAIEYSSNINTTLFNLLSPQQTKCFTYLCKGMTSKDIAEKMQLSPRTIEHYIASMKIKLNCKNTKELIAKYCAS